MGKARNELLSYIRQCLNNGYSFKKIEDALIARGYPQKISEGIILSYKHRGNFLKWLTISFLVLLFIVGIFLSGSGIIGMATLEYKKSYTSEIGLITNASAFYTFWPGEKAELVSVAITGNVIGGEAKVYIENSGRKYLIFDSGKENYKVTDVSSRLLGQRVMHFDAVCEESCSLSSFNSTVYNIIFELSNATLEIDKIHYDLLAGTEVADVPSFIHIPEQKIGLGDSINIHLLTFFNSSSSAEFSYLAEDNTTSIKIDGNLATIKGIRTGKTHAYFIAAVNGVNFMSDLVNIEVTDDVTGDKMVVGPAEEKKSEKESPSSIFPLLLVIMLVVILILVFIPARFFGLSSTAARLERVRKTVGITQSINQFQEMKSQLWKAKDSEKEKILDQMEESIRNISVRLPKSKLVSDFNAKALEFEKIKDKDKAAETYAELRKIYMKAIEAKIPKKEKDFLYKTMEEYYKRLK